jgi:uncharacterized membrane protein
MWDKLTLIGQSLAAMLSHDKAPPNTPPEYVDEMKSINFLRSKKFFVVFSSILMLITFYSVSVFILFLTATVPTITTPFVTIFVETIKIFAIIISAYLGLQAAIDFKYNTETSVVTKSEQNYTEQKIDQKLIQVYQEAFSGDKSYAPITWVEAQSNE